jgi:hypothetical protein
MLSVTIMTANGSPARAVAFTSPLVPLALAGHLLLIPPLGEHGAALVTLGASLVGASAAVASVYQLWRVAPPVGTLARSFLVALVVGAIASYWPTSGMLVFAKLIALGMISLGGYWLIGEFRDSEVALARSWWAGKSETVRVA